MELALRQIEHRGSLEFRAGIEHGWYGGVGRRFRIMEPARRSLRPGTLATGTESKEIFFAVKRTTRLSASPACPSGKSSAEDTVTAMAPAAAGSPSL